MQYVFVSTKTNALHEACEHLLADQTALINTAESIHENLEYFSVLERFKTVSTANRKTICCMFLINLGNVPFRNCLHQVFRLLGNHFKLCLQEWTNA